MEGRPDALVRPIWSPGSNEERKFYDGLFQLADVTNTGKLAGQLAVAFLGRSDLAMPILKQIWDISCDPKLSYLRREDFYVAMRLIATAQSSPGSPISALRLKGESAIPLPLPRMQGLPLPLPGTLSKGMAVISTDTAVMREGLSPVLDPYAMSPQERSKYQSIFPRYDTDQDGFITGQETHALFSKSGLPREHLRQIWDLSDADNDNRLSMAEFCVGMHLIVCVSKKGLAIPTALPRSLAPSFALSPNGSSGTPFLQSPSRRLPTVQPLSTPPSGRGFSSLGPLVTELGDAFSELSGDVPVNDPTSSIGSEAENEVAPSTSTFEQSLAIPESSLASEQPQDKITWRSSSDVPASGKSFSRGGSSDGSSVAPASSQSDIQELTAASNTLAAVTHGVSSAHSQVMAIQSSSVNSVGALVQKLQLEKVSLSAMVDAGKAEHLENERRLRDIGTELETLQAELENLRNQFQEQQQDAMKLREHLSRAAVERATVLAEIKACKAALGAQQVDVKHLREEVDMIYDTQNALQSYKGSLGQGKAPHEPERHEHALAIHEASLPSLEQAPFPPPPQEFEAKSEAPPEPAMPAQTPPPPPESMTLPRVVEDPFAGMMGKEDAESHSLVAPEAPVVSTSMARQPSEEEKNGFDAFPPVGDAFESDPFAVNGFTGDGPTDDPFTATDAVFSNATAAADGFDAFPPSSEAPFDAFGQ